MTSRPPQRKVLKKKNIKKPGVTKAQTNGQIRANQKTISPQSPPLFQNNIVQFKSPLHKLSHFLTHLDFVVKWKQEPFEQLIVILDPEDPGLGEEFQFILQIAFQEEMQASMKEEPVDFEEGATLNFAMGLVLNVAREKTLEYYEIFAMINRILPLGHFSLNETLEPPHAFYSYRLLAPDPNIDMFEVIDIIEMIKAFVLQIYPFIQQLEEEERTAEVIIEDLERTLVENAKKLHEVSQKLTAAD